MQVIDGTVASLKNVHYKWSKNIPPIASMKDGEIFSVLIPDSSTMQAKEDWTLADLKKMDMSKLDAAVGPNLCRRCAGGAGSARRCTGYSGRIVGMVFLGKKCAADPRKV